MATETLDLEQLLKPRKKRKARPGAVDHLKKHWWKPGQSGNPKGRNNPVSLVRILKEFLRDNPQEAGAIVAALIREGKAGNIVAIKETLDRVDGRVVEKHQIEGDLPILLRFVPAQTLLAAPETHQNENLGVGEVKVIDLPSEGYELENSSKTVTEQNNSN